MSQETDNAISALLSGFTSFIENFSDEVVVPLIESISEQSNYFKDAVWASELKQSVLVDSIHASEFEEKIRQSTSDMKIAAQTALQNVDTELLSEAEQFRVFARALPAVGHVLNLDAFDSAVATGNAQKVVDETLKIIGALNNRGQVKPTPI